MKNFDFDVIFAKDRENQDFLYINLNDNGNFTDNNYNEELLEKLGNILRFSIEDHCSNLMEIVGTNEGAGRQLLWLLKDKNCFTLYERYEEIDKFSIKHIKNKAKIR